MTTRVRADPTRTREWVPTHIRWLIHRDLPSVLSIEAGSFITPWTEDDFKHCLRHRNCIGMVAEHPAELILGCMIYELFDDHIHLLNFAVHPDWRRHGVGSQMVKKLVGKLSSHRRYAITLRVHERNLTAQLFLRALGFRATGVERDYYDGPDAGDAYCLAYQARDESNGEG